jgi:hypothetical protein
MGIFFFVLKKIGWFRVDPKDEEIGLDNSYHGGSAYAGNENVASEANGTFGTKVQERAVLCCLPPLLSVHHNVCCPLLSNSR